MSDRVPEYVPPKPVSMATKLGIGAALVVVPLGSVLAYMNLKDADASRNRRAEAGAAYDDEALQRIDPALVKYRQTGTIATGLKYARAIAVDGKGNLLLAGDRKVRTLDETGSVLSEFALPDFPTCIASAPDGTIYVGFREHVEAYSAGGERLMRFPSLGAGAQLTGIAVGGSDGRREILLADAGRRVVVRCDSDGKVLGEFGKVDGAGKSNLVLPSPFLSVHVTGDGKMLVNNPGRHRVETYTEGGELHGFFGAPTAAISGFIGCCNPSQFAVMADGRVITAEKGAGRVKVFLPDGRLEAVVAGPEVFGAAMHGLELAVMADGRVLVLEPGGTEVRMFREIEGGGR